MFGALLREHEQEHREFQLIPQMLTFITSYLHFSSIQHSTPSLHPHLPAFPEIRALFFLSLPPNPNVLVITGVREGREERFFNYLEETDLLEELTKEL